MSLFSSLFSLWFPSSLHTLLQIFSVTLFEKTTLEKGFPGTDHTPENDMDAKQLKLFEF